MSREIHIFVEQNTLTLFLKGICLPTPGEETPGVFFVLSRLAGSGTYSHPTSGGAY